MEANILEKEDFSRIFFLYCVIHEKKNKIWPGLENSRQFGEKEKDNTINEDEPNHQRDSSAVKETRKCTAIIVHGIYV